MLTDGLDSTTGVAHALPLSPGGAEILTTPGGAATGGGLTLACPVASATAMSGVCGGTAKPGHYRGADLGYFCDPANACWLWIRNDSTNTLAATPTRNVGATPDLVIPLGFGAPTRDPGAYNVACPLGVVYGLSISPITFSAYAGPGAINGQVFFDQVAP